MSANFHLIVRQGLQYILPPSGLDTKQKVTVTYRYISWLATSLYYLAIPPYNTLIYKAAVVIALFVFSRIMLDSYIKSGSITTIRTTALVETVGLTLLLIPTGGLESPFIWYALNPVFIASNYLEGIFCWANLLFYLLTSLFISFKMFNVDEMTMIELIQAKSYIILVYFLVTVAMRLVSNMVKHLDNQAQKLHQQKLELMNMNAKLNEANETVNKSMEHVMSLYHIIEAFSSRKEPQTLLEQMAYSIMKIMDCESSFTYLTANKEHEPCLITQGITEVQGESLRRYFENFKATQAGEIEFVRLLKEQRCLITQVKSTSRMYGYMGIVLTPEQNSNSCKINLQLFALLADLVAYILERKHLEQMSAKLAILEEQNRIGNEIHDSVSQRLFSIICGLHALNMNWHRLDAESLSRQLVLLEESTKETSKELRTSIYRLSSSKRGEKVFKEDLESYLTDFESLNGIVVSFEFNGDEGRVSSTMKQAIYRIVREATGNAVRHGKCSELKVQLFIKTTSLDLLIKDNGKGFDTAFILSDKENRGLGLNNMQLLTQSFSGEFELRSRESGTEVQVRIPLSHITDLQEKRRGGVA